MIGERELEKGAGRYDGQAGQLFGEPPKTRQDVARGLNLIEKQERSIDRDVASERQSQVIENLARIGGAERPREPGVALEVELDEVGTGLGVDRLPTVIETLEIHEL